MARRPPKGATTIDNLAKSLASGELLPVYVVTGEEAFLRHRARRMIRDAVVDREGGTVSVFGPEDTIEEVLVDLRGDSLFASRRMVEVIEADAFMKSNGEALVRYLERPSASAVLVLDAEKVDRRTKLPSRAGAVGMMIECSPLHEDRLPRWVAGEAKSRGVPVTTSAAAALIEEVGNNLFALSSELDKLLTYVGDRGKIDVNDVAEIVGRSRSWDVWGLTAALGRREVHEALTIFERLLTDGEKPIAIVGSLNWQLRRLWEARRLLDAGASDRQLMSRVKVGFRYLGPLKEGASRFAQTDLARLVRMLLKVDVKLKSTMLPEKLLIERFLVEACEGGAAARQAAGH